MAKGSGDTIAGVTVYWQPSEGHDADSGKTIFPGETEWMRRNRIGGDFSEAALRWPVWPRAACAALTPRRKGRLPRKSMS
jgi:hypothetical protein